MGTLRKALLLLGLLAASAAAPAAAGPVDRWSAHVAEASERFGVPREWVERVIGAESGGRTMLDGRPIESPAGAVGLMQLMPATWQEMRLRYGLGADPQDPHDNIVAGTAYLRSMYDRFGYPGLFAAYNAGPARYSDFLARGRRLPAETLAYVAQLTGRAAAARPASLTPPARPSFFVAGAENERLAAVEPQPIPKASQALFVTLAASPAEQP